MGSTSRKQLEDWLKTIKVPGGSEVADVGGAQKPVKERLGDKGETSSYTILDLPNPHEGAGYIDTAFDLQEEVHTDLYNVYDVVFCLEVMEYVINPLTAVKNIARILRPGGILYISFQFVYPAHNPVAEDCLRYTFRGCEKLLEEAGFEIADYQVRNAEVISPVMVYEAEGMKMAAGVNHDATGYLIKAIKR